MHAPLQKMNPPVTLTVTVQLMYFEHSKDDSFHFGIQFLPLPSTLYCNTPHFLPEINKVHLIHLILFTT